MATVNTRFETFRVGYSADGTTMGLWQQNRAQKFGPPTLSYTGSGGGPVFVNDPGTSKVVQILSPTQTQVALAGTVTTLAHRAWTGEMAKFMRWDYVRAVRHGLGYKPLVHVSPRGPQRIGCYADREYLYFGLQSGTVGASGFVPDGSAACPLPNAVDYVVYTFGIQWSALTGSWFNGFGVAIGSGTVTAWPTLGAPAKPDAVTSLDYWEFYFKTNSGYTYAGNTGSLSGGGTDPGCRVYSLRADVGTFYGTAKLYGQFYGVWTQTDSSGKTTYNGTDYRGLPGMLQAETVGYTSATARATWLSSLPPMPSS